jgi:NAD+ synthase (glutamine-hydrolysing)
MKIALAQINTVVGDIRGNVDRVLERTAAARDAGTDLVVFHEMCLSGYPPHDLVERPAFVAGAQVGLERIREASTGFPGLGIVVGLPLPSRREGGKGVANVAVLVSGGKVLHTQEKALLPTYDVFDEARYFDPAASIEPVPFAGEVLGLSICEDAWNDPELLRNRLYDVDPIAILAGKGATVMVNISASPFTVGKESFRVDLVRSHARRHGVPVVMVNQVGGNDELVFDGGSLYADGSGELRAALPMFDEAMEFVDTGAPGPAIAYEPPGEAASTYAALVLGTRDYLGKSGFSRAVVGLSGGIDSAVTLAIAVDALGAENVRTGRQPRRRAGRRAHRRDDGGLRPHAGRGARGDGARHHRGKHPGAHQGQRIDGVLEQVRKPRVVDGEQE